jgi:uncharacterized ParB-like nuclease family protein
MPDVKLDDIDMDRSRELSPRQRTDPATVDRYALALDALPPVKLFNVDGVMIVADGLHRIPAHQKAGRETVPVEPVTPIASCKAPDSSVDGVLRMDT